MFDPPFTPSEKNIIDFHAEDVDPQLGEENILADWIRQAILSEGGQLHFINYIFCSDEYLLQINREYLQHDTLTDIITFPYSETAIESDIFISTERVAENAISFGVPYHTELQRVMIHGVLHLLGFGDKTAEEKKEMRRKEEEYLSIFKNSKV